MTETGSASNQLRRTDVTALSQSECYQFWGQANVLDQHLCAMGMDTPDGAGACTVRTVVFLGPTLHTVNPL